MMKTLVAEFHYTSYRPEKAVTSRRVKLGVSDLRPNTLTISRNFFATPSRHVFRTLK